MLNGDTISPMGAVARAKALVPNAWVLHGLGKKILPHAGM